MTRSLGCYPVFDKLPAVMPDDRVGKYDVQPVSTVSRVSAVVCASLAAAAVLITAVVTGCGGHGRVPGTIVFESDRSGREALYAVRPDGSGLTALLDLPREGAVFWTP